MFSRWRLHRRILHQPFRQAAIPNYHAALIRSAHKMLFSFLQDPTNYTSHFEMLVTTVHHCAEADLYQVSCFVYASYCV